MLNKYMTVVGNIFSLNHIRSIKSKFTLIYILLILLPMSVSTGIAYYKSSTALNTQASKYTLLLMKQLNRSINAYVEQMDKISKVPMLSYKEMGNDIQNILNEGDDISEQERINNQYKMRDFFLNLKFMDKYIANITIYSRNGSTYTFDDSISTSKDYKEEEWYKRTVDAKGNKILLGTHIQKGEESGPRLVFSLARQINDFYTRKPLGVIIIDADIRVINDICREIDFGKGGSVIIAGEDGNIIFDNQEKNISGRLYGYMDKVLKKESGEIIQKIDNKNLLITWYTSEFTGWKLIGMIPINEIHRDIISMRYIVFFVLVLLSIFAFIIFFRISSSIINPVNKLRSLMKKAEKGDFDVSIKIDSDDEIRQLGESFNIMIARIKELINKVYNSELAKKQAELNALQSQINPHYLYNTLESIRMMAALNDDTDVMNMITILGETFRYSINIANEIVTIEQEIKHVNNYLTIQKMRYQNRLQADIIIDENIMQCRIIKLVIQPIVENSIYHGLGNKMGIGHVSVIGRKENNTVKLEIIDDGTGMTNEQLVEIREVLKSNKPSNNKRSIGLSNINERLRLYFGEAYRMEITSSPDAGTRVSLMIPVMEETY